MKTKDKKSRETDAVMRLLEKDPVIIPQDDGHDETSLPSQNSPWPGLLFFIGLMVAGWLLWRFAPAWLSQVFHS